MHLPLVVVMVTIAQFYQKVYSRGFTKTYSNELLHAASSYHKTPDIAVFFNTDVAYLGFFLPKITLASFTHTLQVSRHKNVIVFLLTSLSIATVNK